MKNRNVYILFFVLLFVIIFSIYLTTKITKTQIEPQESGEGEEKLQIPLVENILPPHQQKPIGRRSITVLKQSPAERPERLAREASEKLEKMLKSGETSSSSAKNAAKNNRERQEASEASASGIKKLNKYPSQQQREEMQSRGIVIY